METLCGLSIPPPVPNKALFLAWCITHPYDTPHESIIESSKKEKSLKGILQGFSDQSYRSRYCAGIDSLSVLHRLLNDIRITTHVSAIVVGGYRYIVVAEFIVIHGVRGQAAALQIIAHL